MHKLLTDLVPKSYSDMLLKEFLNFSNWSFTPSASNVDENYDKNDPNILDSIQFVHGIFNHQIDSPLYHTVLPVIWFFEKETGIKVKRLLRIKVNCLTRDGFELKYNPPHVDIVESGFLSLIYYINDSDGDTVLFNKTIDQGFDNLKVVERITPRQGSAFLISSNQLHASSCPIQNNQRLVINFILEPEEQSC
jgi:hypothetical protein